MTPDALLNNPRQKALARKTALWNERSSYFAHWQEISEYMQPRAGRYFVSDRNRGDKRHRSIINETAMFAKRTLSAGLMSGMTSPARPWFRLALQDKDLMEQAGVKAWLHSTTDLMRAIFSASNTYNSLHTLYGELALFGTGADIVLPDFDNVIHHYPLTAGEFAIATDYRGRVNTLAREFQMTVDQVVEQFGKTNVSVTIKNLYDSHRYDAPVNVIQLIEPRRDRDASRKDGKNKPIKSVYFESGAENWEKFLRESGFDHFPALCPRWEVTSNDDYGESPAMIALGGTKHLQQEELRKAQAIDYQTNPPLQVPTAYKNQTVNRLPGGVMYVDAANPSGGIRSAFEVNLNLQHLREDIMQVEERIKTAFYADLFLMLANDTRSGITATEVAERHEEKLLALGPVLERLHNELLNPLIDSTFDYCARAGILPPPPPELEGLDLQVEFVSVLAQAQRAVAANGMDRLLGTVGTMAALWPEVRHKVDALQVVDDYADVYGVNPNVIVPDDVVAERIAQEQQAAQAQQMAAAGMAAADAANKLAGADLEGNNVLSGIMAQYSGYGTAGLNELAPA